MRERADGRVPAGRAQGRSRELGERTRTGRQSGEERQRIGRTDARRQVSPGER